MVKLKWLKKWRERKPGDISNVAEKSAKNFVSQGYAEYIEEPKETKKKIEKKKEEKEEIEVKWIKDKSGKKASEIIKVTEEMAEHLINKGDAEYINEPELNYDQKQAIKLETEKKLPELAKHLKEEGRQEQTKKIVDEILDEGKITDEERATVEKEELEKKVKIQKEFKKLKKSKENELYSLKMNVVSLLAQKKRREATEEIVEYIENKEYLYTIKDDIKSEVWVYQEGVYKPNGKSHIAEQCRKILEEHFTTHLKNEILSKIEADTYIESEEFFKNNYIEEIPVLNGILNIKTKKLLPFNPKKIFFNKLPINYNPKAKCLNIEKHFKETLKNEEDAKVMFEIFGFFLYKDYFIEKAIMFVGDGRNGKGKTIDLMKRFLGADNCCSVSLNQLSDGGFRVWDLFGNMANLAGDLSSNALKDTAMLKQTTGRDLIGADRKNKSTINFVNYAKHVFACNDLPRVYDFSRGFWERWVLFEFPYTFVKKSIYDKLSKEEKKNQKLMDIFIIDKLTTKEELSGLLNKAIEGLHKILKQKDFSYSVGVNEIKRFWVRKSDSFTAFAMDHLKEDYNELISKARLRKAFSRYCKEHKIRGASDRNIKVVLEEMFGVTERQETGGSRVWDGVKLKEESKYNYMEGKLSQE